MFAEELSHLGQGVHCGEEWVSGLGARAPTSTYPHQKGSFLGVQVGQGKVGG